MSPRARPPFAVAWLVAVWLVAGLGGCVPYSVGATPATVAPRAVEPSVILQAASSRRDLDTDDDVAGPTVMVGNEARLGLDERSDVGVRIGGLGSFTATYKRRLAGAPDGDRGAALLVGAGIVGTSHLHAEATLVASAGPLAVDDRITPYYGFRAQALAPFADDARSSAPAVGVFAGARFGWPDLAVSPELGVFYSPSPLRGDQSLLVVPSVTVRGDRLRRALGI